MTLDDIVKSVAIFRHKNTKNLFFGLSNEESDEELVKRTYLIFFTLHFMKEMNK